jgi:hypothetical protein
MKLESKRTNNQSSIIDNHLAMPSTPVENVLQISPFMQNKPNSPNVQLNLTLFITMIYTIFTSLTKVKNKPNQTQNKPNSNPIAERPKMNTNIYYTKVYKNKSAIRREKTNPIQTQFQKFELSAMSICAKISCLLKYKLFDKVLTKNSRKRVDTCLFRIKKRENPRNSLVKLNLLRR